MDIKDILKKKCELESSINELLEKFSQETGLQIEEINVHESNVECESELYNVFYHRYVSCEIRI